MAPPAPGKALRPDAASLRAPVGQIASLPWTAMEEPAARHAWEALAACAAEPNPFFESWYLLPSLRALDPGGQVRILRFDFDGECAGVLPIRRESRYYGWPLPHVRNWVHANCFLGSPLVARGMERAFWRALLAWADRGAGAALFLHLAALPLDGPLHDALVAVLAEQDRPSGLVLREERALLQSGLSPDAYLEASLTGKKRKELRRQFARLAEQGELTVERRTDEERLARWVEDFLALEASGWKGRAGSALASHETTRAMFREALSGAATRGRLERLTLSLDGEPLAMLATFLTPPGAFSFKTAFDERFSRFSPGVLLQRENLAILENPAIHWTDSCASADHPMIDHIWRERRAIGRISIAIGRAVRRAVFRRLLLAELGRTPEGLQP